MPTRWGGRPSWAPPSFGGENVLEMLRYTFELLCHTYLLLTFCAYKLAGPSDAPMLAEEHEWYEEFGRKIKEVE